MIKWKNTLSMIIVINLFVCLRILYAGNVPANNNDNFINAASKLQQQLDDSLTELSSLRERIVSEKIPLNKELNDRENELIQIRRDYQKKSRLLDTRTLDLSNLSNEIKTRQEESTYVSNLLGEYIRNFESRLHIAELQRYETLLDETRLVAENSNLPEKEIYSKQVEIVNASLDRLNMALGGDSFNGTAINSTGLVKNGTFVIVGPTSIFSSDDGADIGIAEQRLGSLEPTIISFQNPSDTNASKQLVKESKGYLPFDPTLGNALKIESTKESLLKHLQNGGPVMIPIILLAVAAFIVAIYKWFVLSRQKKPSQKNIDVLLDAVSRYEQDDAIKAADKIKGPAGEMLVNAVKHIKEPSELIEEVMYEIMLSTRLKLQSLLPFVAISASAAPLLGLLGTVTGIINTFKLITIFGSGDVKTLSGGISEALITTKFGLIVAIPSLLIYAFLSRKAKSIISQMEKTAISFINQVNRTPCKRTVILKKDENDFISDLVPDSETSDNNIRKIVMNNTIGN